LMRQNWGEKVTRATRALSNWTPKATNWFN
jgi:hypothetical protein